ncbi:unnamed protein product [Closterium sp. Naga37s-1]|nr:unnamed protein product [Closterium sp. Naga37s-1]
MLPVPPFLRPSLPPPLSAGPPPHRTGLQRAASTRSGSRAHHPIALVYNELHPQWIKSVTFFVRWRRSLRSLALTFTHFKQLDKLRSPLNRTFASLTSLTLKLRGCVDKSYLNAEYHQIEDIPWTRTLDCPGLQRLKLGRGRWNLQHGWAEGFKSLRSLTLKHVDWDGSPGGGGTFRFDLSKAQTVRFYFPQSSLQLFLTLSSSLETFSAMAKRLVLSCKSTEPLALQHLSLYGQQQLVISSLHLASVQVAYLNGPPKDLHSHDDHHSYDPYSSNMDLYELPSELSPELSPDRQSMHRRSSAEFSWVQWLGTIAPTVEVLIVRHGVPVEGVDAEWSSLRSLGIVVESEERSEVDLKVEKRRDDGEREVTVEEFQERDGRLLQQQRQQERQQQRQEQQLLQQRVLQLQQQQQQWQRQQQQQQHRQQQPQRQRQRQQQQQLLQEQQEQQQQQQQQLLQVLQQQQQQQQGEEEEEEEQEGQQQDVRPPFILAPNLRSIFFPTRTCEQQTLTSLREFCPSLALYCISRRSFYWEKQRKQLPEAPVVHVRKARSGVPCACFAEKRPKHCDVLVLVACAEGVLLDGMGQGSSGSSGSSGCSSGGGSRAFYAPVVTPFEALMALEEGREWTGEYRMMLDGAGRPWRRDLDRIFGTARDYKGLEVPWFMAPGGTPGEGGGDARGRGHESKGGDEGGRGDGGGVGAFIPRVAPAIDAVRVVEGREGRAAGYVDEPQKG